MINLLGTTIVDTGIEIKKKISTIEFLESEKSYICKYTLLYELI